MPRGNQMNLKELSRILGLSQTTVSRALNGYPEVNIETRRRVEAAAKRHNYRPNSRAKGLATGNSMAIAHVIPVSSNREMMNPVFADFINGASEVYGREGYDMVLSVVRDEDEADTYRDMAARTTVDGVIVHSPLVGDPRLELLRGLGLPFVAHGRFGRDETTYSWLDMDNRRAFGTATRHLIELGHRRIAFLNGGAQMVFSHRREEGFDAAFAAAGLHPDPQLIRHSEMTEENGFAQATAMLDLPAPPTAFLASSIVQALGIERAAHVRGLRLGRDLSLVTHDDELSFFPNGPEPRFTAMLSPVREHGRLAAEMLLRRIAAPLSQPEQRLLTAELVLGPSTAPAGPLNNG